jgi:hypothetical protein
MIIDIYNISIIFSLIFIVIVIDMVRRNKLQEKYSILWIAFAFLLIIFSAFPRFILKISELVNVKYAPALIFLIGFLFMIVYMLSLTATVSKQEKKIIKLAQEVAMLKAKTENKSDEEK